MPAPNVNVPRLLPVPPVLDEARPTVITSTNAFTVPPVKSLVPWQLVVPLLDSPSAAGKRAAFQVYPRGTNATGPMLGHAVRTDRWRYVEWRKADESVVARELYDMQHDPDETVNLSDNEKNAHTIEDHGRLLAERLAVKPPPGLTLLGRGRASGVKRAGR